MKAKLHRACLSGAALLFLSACGTTAWNDPYSGDSTALSAVEWIDSANTLYSAFVDRPKHLDPAQSYTEDEATFTGQIYEPPLQYHYLKRPYTLISGSTEMPLVRFFDVNGKQLPDNSPAEQVAESIYEIRIKPGVRYQPHPAFALDTDEQMFYRDLNPEKLKGINRISDFSQTGSREVVADDYIYQIKRLAHPHVHSPVFGTMSEHIIGLKSLADELNQTAKNQGTKETWLDLNKFQLIGVERVDAKTFRIRIKGKYPQFVYWLAMPFFAPVPREVDRFYSQPGMAEKNLTLDWWPVGSGPYMLIENDPNRRMVLVKNPNFHGETYPCEGEEEDRVAGLLADCGKALPLIERAVFSREKESIPYWNKFLQGYYDASGISSEGFDQAVRISVSGEIGLSDEMRERGIRLLTSVRASIFYFAFNMLDPVLGDMGPKGKKLRQAISIAINIEEFISIFMNGRGVPAMGPLPPGFFGYISGKPGINPVVYEWDGDDRNGALRRKNIADAKRLLAEAGYPNGRNAETGEPLVLNIDTTAGGLGDKSQLSWITRQFESIGIQLVVRATDWNRLQEKMRKGSYQISFVGWSADYPDPENFFFLLYGPGSRAKNNGENVANYSNTHFDRLFEQMKNMDNSPIRQGIIRQMENIVRDDAPWAFGFNPKNYTLGHRWLYNRKPNNIANNILKYQRIDTVTRERLRREWNQPVIWPLIAGVFALAFLLIPAIVSYRKRERKTGRF